MPKRLVMLVAFGAFACASEQSSSGQPSAAQGGTVAAADGCPLPAETVSQIVGQPVGLAPTPVRLMDTCSYQLASDPSVEIELSIKPANLGEILFAGLHNRARTRLGGETRAESIVLGDEGWAYGAKSGSEAAARKGEKLFHASLTSGENLFKPVKDEMIRLVSAMISATE